MLQKHITINEASERYGISDGRLRTLAGLGIIRGIKPGRDWLLEEKSVKAYAENRPKPGPKPKRRRDAQRKRA